MKTFVIATLATATLAKNLNVSQVLAQLEIPAPDVLDKLPYDLCMKVYPEWDCKHQEKLNPEGDGYLLGDSVNRDVHMMPRDLKQVPSYIGRVRPLAQSNNLAQRGGLPDTDGPVLCEYPGNHQLLDPISALAEITGITVPQYFPRGMTIAGDFYEVYNLVNCSPASLAMDMLMNFEIYHTVMDLFCSRRGCAGGEDNMGDELEKIGMSEEDIDLAINIYNIAANHEINNTEAQKIMNELVEGTANETGLSKDSVELVIKQAAAESGLAMYNYTAFLEFLKIAKSLVAKGIEVGPKYLHVNRKFENPLDPIVEETREIVHALTEDNIEQLNYYDITI